MLAKNHEAEVEQMTAQHHGDREAALEELASQHAEELAKAEDDLRRKNEMHENALSALAKKHALMDEARAERDEAGAEARATALQELKRGHASELERAEKEILSKEITFRKAAGTGATRPQSEGSAR